jgi:hypothetical protein
LSKWVEAVLDPPASKAETVPIVVLITGQLATVVVAEVMVVPVIAIHWEMEELVVAEGAAVSMPTQAEPEIKVTMVDMDTVQLILMALIEEPEGAAVWEVSVKHLFGLQDILAVAELL